MSAVLLLLFGVPIFVLICLIAYAQDKAYEERGKR